MTKRISFLSAHPDDLEFFCGMFVRLAVKNGHDVEIVSMTRGEYGTMNRNLKGEKIARIRSQELRDAAHTHGVPSERVKFLGLIDGHVTIRAAMKALRKYLQERIPDILFVPEYIFSVYTHSDHLNTGIASLSLLKLESGSPRPLLLTYHSYKNTHYLQCDLRSTGKALGIHKSQVQVIGLLYPLRWIFNLLNGFFCCRRFIFMEACRRVYFDRKIQVSLLDHLFHALYSLGRLVFRAWSED
ncbi:MAG: PIG-L family deacetylase [Promethearchaeota archaeon]|nr:MAG: PIG-L family deacetylase [Candidatus Lokiarchaeota archaeon]